MRRWIGSAVMLLALLMTLLLAGHAGADVLSSSVSGFVVRSEANIGAGPDSVYHALVVRIAGWWDPAHTFSGDSRNLSLDPRPGGCFCEKLPNGGGVRHLEVVYVSPGETLRLVGAMGPLQGEGLAGSMTWGLQGMGDSTKVELTYGVGGYFPGDLQEIAPIVDAVLRAQLLRLKMYVEVGTPEPR